MDCQHGQVTHSSEPQWGISAFLSHLCGQGSGAASCLLTLLCSGRRGSIWLCTGGLLTECASGHLPWGSEYCWLFLACRTAAFGVCFSERSDPCCFSPHCWSPAQLLEQGRQQGGSTRALLPISGREVLPFSILVAWPFQSQNLAVCK